MGKAMTADTGKKMTKHGRASDPRKLGEIESLFHKLRDKGVFWSYAKDISYEDVGSDLFIEHLLKYGDFQDIRSGVDLFDKTVVKKVWEERLKSDQRFIKLNVMLARVFFNMDVDSGYFKKVTNERLEKLKLFNS